MKAVKFKTISHIHFYSTAPIDGHWGRWSSWAECSAKCGQGQKHRQRKCNDPVPSHGGQGCSGVASESKACEVMPCGLSKYSISLCNEILLTFRF